MHFTMNVSRISSKHALLVEKRPPRQTRYQLKSGELSLGEILKPASCWTEEVYIAFELTVQLQIFFNFNLQSFYLGRDENRKNKRKN
jgi:hypothetical protein